MQSITVSARFCFIDQLACQYVLKRAHSSTKIQDVTGRRTSRPVLYTKIMTMRLRNNGTNRGEIANKMWGLLCGHRSTNFCQ